MDARMKPAHREVWTAQDQEDGQGRSYEVHVCYGKPIDLLALKSPVVADFALQLSQVQSTRRAAYDSFRTERLAHCPICGSSTLTSELRVTIYGGHYHQCADCDHCFIINRPTEGALEHFYASNSHFASTYTDPRLTEVRVQQVAWPKARWMVEQFTRRYGREPRSVLDVGAGGGHFVHACRQLGLHAEGIELSEASRAFCRERFGFELHAVDFLNAQEPFTHVDLITFWTVLEHVPSPLRLLARAHQLLADRDTLVVAEVPRWSCLTTAIQQRFPHAVVRHLDPLAHIHCFTDSSLITAFETSGFAPVAAWYFGMDSYELMMQLSYLLSGSGRLVTEELAPHIPFLQETIDQNRLSDAIVLAGAPLEAR